MRCSLRISRLYRCDIGDWNIVLLFRRELLMISSSNRAGRVFMAVGVSINVLCINLRIRVNLCSEICYVNLDFNGSLVGGVKI